MLSNVPLQEGEKRWRHPANKDQGTYSYTTLPGSWGAEVVSFPDLISMGLFALPRPIEHTPTVGSTRACRYDPR